jgi:hypothetical protein
MSKLLPLSTAVILMMSTIGMSWNAQHDKSWTLTFTLEPGELVATGEIHI